MKFRLDGGSIDLVREWYEFVSDATNLVHRTLPSSRCDYWKVNDAIAAVPAEPA
jgi:hypothetical protein